MLTQEYLKSILDYDLETGIFSWKVARKGIQKGRKCRPNHDGGYVTIRIDRTLYYAHRLVWLYVYGVWPKNEIDHKNCNRSDNRICNLREATRLEQVGNLSLPSHNTHGTKGVYFDGRGNRRKRWYAQICKGGKQVNIGHFLTKEEAKAAYAKAAAEHFGVDFVREA